jgi:hypothetical protein
MERASVGASSRYAVLAANVSKVIINSSGRSLEIPERKLLERAAELLDKIVQGSQFIEHKAAYVLSEPRENLFAFDHAISALRKVEINSDAQEGLTNIFALLKDDLLQLAEGGNVEEPRRFLIRGFFDAIGELYYRDVADSAVVEKESFERTPL